MVARSSHKRLTTQVVQVDLRDLKAHGWSLRLPGGSRAERLGEHAVIDWGGRRFTVSLTETTPQYGGQRFWFRCPQCGRRARIMYSPDFNCRRCSGLLHPSTRQTMGDRAINRAVRLRRDLGGSGSLLEPFPRKPKGMRRATWLGLLSTCQRLGSLGVAAVLTKLSDQLTCAAMRVAETTDLGRKN
jgi:hypothetical protein